ncbi:MAG TPA: NAD(P)H-dependent oxidoreductase [Thermoanaerobaculia bacterium]|nr:NAD(P)H-dependent oxidoreductase [Thermoanaerobaculia bacterium]
MTEPAERRGLHVLGIAGSLRRASYNRALLRAAVELAPPGMEIEIFDQVGALPLFNQDLEAGGDAAPVAALKAAVQRADALLVATPEYNYGLTAPLKNAVDWASRPPGKSALRGKPAAIMGASMGPGGTIRAQLALRQAFLYTEVYALLKPEVLVGSAHEKFDDQGNLTDARTRQSVAALLGALAEWVGRLRA